MHTHSRNSHDSECLVSDMLEAAKQNGLCGFAVTDHCDIKTDDTVLIIGCGMIGLIMLQLTKNAGAAKLIVIEPNDEKRLFAEKLGADLCINPFSEDAEKPLKKVE